MPLAFCAPRRLNISGWSRATTLATRFRSQLAAASDSSLSVAPNSNASAIRPVPLQRPRTLPQPDP
ncbi:hypothetical protein D3C76_1448410 [compost metagenome]